MSQRLTELGRRQRMPTNAEKKFSNENAKTTIPNTYYNGLNTIGECGTFRLSELRGK